MAEVRFNQHGELINNQTGQVLGNIQNGSINLNSNGAEMRTLEDLGVGLPDFEQYEKENKENTTSSENISLSNQESTYANETYQNKEEPNKNFSSIKLTKTKYEVTSESNFLISFGLVEYNNRFVPIKKESVDEYPYAELHWVKFRMWRYDEELVWKKQCLQYNSAARFQLINHDKLNQKKIRNLILDWSFGQNEDRLKLLHCDGKLSDESYKIFMGLYPSIANTIVDLMNNVLENNQ